MQSAEHADQEEAGPRKTGDMAELLAVDRREYVTPRKDSIDRRGEQYAPHQDKQPEHDQGVEQDKQAEEDEVSMFDELTLFAPGGEATEEAPAYETPAWPEQAGKLQDAEEAAAEEAPAYEPPAWPETSASKLLQHAEEGAAGCAEDAQAVHIHHNPAQHLPSSSANTLDAVTINSSPAEAAKVYIHAVPSQQRDLDAAEEALAQAADQSEEGSSSYAAGSFELTSSTAAQATEEQEDDNDHFNEAEFVSADTEPASLVELPSSAAAEEEGSKADAPSTVETEQQQPAPETEQAAHAAAAARSVMAQTSLRGAKDRQDEGDAGLEGANRSTTEEASDFVTVAENFVTSEEVTVEQPASSEDFIRVEEADSHGYEHLDLHDREVTVEGKLDDDGTDALQGVPGAFQSFKALFSKKSRFIRVPDAQEEDIDLGGDDVSSSSSEPDQDDNTRDNSTANKATSILPSFLRGATSSTTTTSTWWFPSSESSAAVAAEANETSPFARLGCTRAQRLVGFVVCALIGTVCMFLSLVRLPIVLIAPIHFALPYSLGNILALGATTFLVGPARQWQLIAAPHRRLAALGYVVAICCTLTSAVVLQSAVLTLVFVTAQFMSLVWYAASYIPYAQELLERSFFRRATFFRRSARAQENSVPGHIDL
eukprot:g77256.t1